VVPTVPFERGTHESDFELLGEDDEPVAPPRAAMASKGGGHGSGSGGQGIHLLPEYDGTRRKGMYREWKRQVLAYQFGYDVEPKMLAPRVWLRLTGEAKDAVDTIDIEDLAKDDGMKKLWTLLDKEFDQDLICAIEEVVE
jgi:hypothetical protein